MYTSETLAKQASERTGAVILLSYAPNGSLQAEIPGPDGFPGHFVTLPDNDLKAMTAINRLLASIASNGRGQIGEHSAPTDHMLRHDLYHSLSDSPGCPFCKAHAAGRVKGYDRAGNVVTVLAEDIDI